MRKVRVCINGDFVNTNHNREIEYGFFHEWALAGNTDEGIEKYALVEMKDGTIREVQTHKIQFIEPTKE